MYVSSIIPIIYNRISATNFRKYVLFFLFILFCSLFLSFRINISIASEQFQPDNYLRKSVSSNWFQQRSNYCWWKTKSPFELLLKSYTNWNCPDEAVCLILFILCLILEILIELHKMMKRQKQLVKYCKKARWVDIFLMKPLIFWMFCIVFLYSINLHYGDCWRDATVGGEMSLKDNLSWKIFCNWYFFSIVVWLFSVGLYIEGERLFYHPQRCQNIYYQCIIRLQCWSPFV